MAYTRERERERKKERNIYSPTPSRHARRSVFPFRESFFFSLFSHAQINPHIHTQAHFENRASRTDDDADVTVALHEMVSRYVMCEVDNESTRWCGDHVARILY